MQWFHVIYTFYLHYFTFLRITSKIYNNIDSKLKHCLYFMQSFKSLNLETKYCFPQNNYKINKQQGVVVVQRGEGCQKKLLQFCKSLNFAFNISFTNMNCFLFKTLMLSITNIIHCHHHYHNFFFIIIIAFFTNLFQTRSLDLVKYAFNVSNDLYANLCFYAFQAGSFCQFVSKYQ